MHTHNRRYIVCSASQQYYVCAFNGFNGCCSINPCSLLAGCPDIETTGIANGPGAPTKAGQATIVQTVESSATPLTEVSSMMTTLETSSQAMVSTVSGVTTMMPSTMTVASLVSQTSNEVVASTSNSNYSGTSAASASGTRPTTSLVGSTPTPVAAAAGAQSSSKSRGGAVAGSVVGAAIGLAILSLLWFCRRRVKRRDKKVIEEVQVQQVKVANADEGNDDPHKGFF